MICQINPPPEEQTETTEIARQTAAYWSHIHLESIVKSSVSQMVNCDPEVGRPNKLYGSWVLRVISIFCLRLSLQDNILF